MGRALGGSLGQAFGRSALSRSALSRRRPRRLLGGQHRVGDRCLEGSRLDHHHHRRHNTQTTTAASTSTPAAQSRAASDAEIAPPASWRPYSPTRKAPRAASPSSISSLPREYVFS